MGIAVEDVSQALRRLRRARRRVRRRPRRLAHGAARPERRRQVHPAAGDRRARGAGRGHGRSSTARTPPACPPRKRGVGFVFQHYAAVQAHDRARTTWRFGLKIRKRPKAGDRRARVDELLAPRSPGRACRAAIRRSSRAASASAWPWRGRWPCSPRCCCSTSRSAPSTPRVRKELRAWLRRLHDEVHVTTVFVTHDQEEAMEVADQIVVLNHGTVEQVGAPRDLYEQPANDFVMQLRGARHPARASAGCARTTSTSCSRRSRRHRGAWWSGSSTSASRCGSSSRSRAERTPGSRRPGTGPASSSCVTASRCGCGL